MNAIKYNVKTILVSVITGIILMIATSIIGFISTIRKNEISIAAIEVGKVEQEKFNRFLKTYAEHTILMEQRLATLSVLTDKLEIRQREIELVKLQRLEQSIAILDNKIRILLGNNKDFDIDSCCTDSSTVIFFTNLNTKDYDIQRTIKGTD